jgi:hypothetical protein
MSPNHFSLMCFRANLDSDMSILSINFDTTGFCSPVFSLHLFLSLTSEIIGGLSMSSLSCSKKVSSTVTYYSMSIDVKNLN